MYRSSQRNHLLSVGAEWVSVSHSDVSTAQSSARPPTATERPEPLLLHDTRMSAERGRLRKTTNKDAAIKVTGEPCTRCPAFSSAKTPQCLPALPSRALHSELRPPLFFRATIVSCLSCPFLSSDSSLGFEGKLRGSHATLGVGPSSSRVPREEGRGAAELRTYRRLSGLPGRIRTCCAWY